MTESESDIPVHIKNLQEEYDSHISCAGLCSGLIIPIVGACVLRGEWCAPLMLLFPLCMIALAYLIHLLMPDDYVVLYPDRMELPICGKRKRLLAWSKVKSLRWSMNGRTDPIQVFIARSGLMLFPWIFLYLTRISLSDRVTLIRYLRTAGAGVQQDGWPEFCLKLRYSHCGRIPKREK